jgi:hypothetical protein
VAALCLPDRRRQGEWTDGHLEIAPGGTAQLRVRVVNGSGVVDQFVAAVLGLEPGMTPPPQRIGLFPDQEGTLTIDIAVPAEQPPPASGCSRSGSPPSTTRGCPGWRSSG